VPAPTPLAEKLVTVLFVAKFARLARPGPDPASMMYVATGSPDDGAPHVSVTVLPLDDEDRLIGAAGTVAAAPTVRRRIRAAATHPGLSCAACRHLAKSTALAPNSADAVDTVTIAAGDPTAARDGDIGAEPAPQPIVMERGAKCCLRRDPDGSFK
jgi:hypothetical protein